MNRKPPVARASSWSLRSPRRFVGIAILAIVCLIVARDAAAVTVTPVAPPISFRSLGNAGVFVMINGASGQGVKVSVPVSASQRQWLVPETLHLARWDPVQQAFQSVGQSSFDLQSGSVTATLNLDGIYGVFGMARAAHVAAYQLELCGALAAGATAHGFPRQHRVLFTCRVFLCAEVNVTQWASVWTATLGRSVTRVELGQYLGGVCDQCSSEPLKPADFPECMFQPRSGLPDVSGQLVAFPCPDRKRTCRDFDKDSVCDNWEMCNGGNPLRQDTDSDGLRDGEELVAGTELGSKDTDGDGLLDGWEVHGFDADGDGTVDVDLAALGASPLRKDLLVEVAWLFDDGDGDGVKDPGEVSFEPSPGVIGDAEKVFKASPLKNPDGTTGVNLIVKVADVGVPMPPEFRDDTSVLFWEEYEENGIWQVRFLEPFDDVKAAHPDQAKLHIARYSLWIQQIAPGKTTSGMSENILTPNFVVSTGFYRSNRPNLLDNNAGNAGLSLTDTLHDIELGTFLHELGHALGLYHGGSLDPFCGNRERRFEPNYPSVMNYFHQKPGLDGLFKMDPNSPAPKKAPILRCAVNKGGGPPWVCFKRGSNRVWGYREFSGGLLPPIDESRLDEMNGLPGVPGLSGQTNLDLNDPITPGVVFSMDLNDDGCDDQILTDHDDWAAMVFEFW